MEFTKLQISELMRKHVEKENGLHDLMEIMLESMMVSERSEFLGSVAMEHKAFDRLLPNITCDKTLFPD